MLATEAVAAPTSDNFTLGNGTDPRGPLPADTGIHANVSLQLNSLLLNSPLLDMPGAQIMMQCMEYNGPTYLAQTFAVNSADQRSAGFAKFLRTNTVGSIRNGNGLTCRCV